VCSQAICAPAALDLQVHRVDVLLQPLAVPNATPLQLPQAWSLRFSCTVAMCLFRSLFVAGAVGARVLAQLQVHPVDVLRQAN
jgi:hypothetical protein